MDRPTTGRRHVRAGSVHVTELITKQASQPEPLGSEIVPLPPGTHRRPQSKGVQIAKATSLGIATVVLCGAVVMASAIANERRDAAQPQPDSTVEITGEQALLPDRLDRTLPAGEVAVPPAGPPAAPKVADDPTPDERSVERTADSTGTSPPDGNTPAAPLPQTGPELAPPTDLDLVRQFYDNLPTTPEVAFGLLAPGLLDTTLGEFLESWSMVSAIEELHVTQQADGVLAVVGMRLADGGHLRIHQLLTVGDSPRRIVGVQLLSAQRH